MALETAFAERESDRVRRAKEQSVRALATPVRGDDDTRVPGRKDGVDVRGCHQGQIGRKNQERLGAVVHGMTTGLDQSLVEARPSLRESFDTVLVREHQRFGVRAHHENVIDRVAGLQGLQGVEQKGARKVVALFTAEDGVQPALGLV